MNYKTLIKQILINVIIRWQITVILLLQRLFKLKKKILEFELTSIGLYSKDYIYLVEELHINFQEASRILLIAPVNLCFVFHPQATELRLCLGG